jgi:hypothetical protein
MKLEMIREENRRNFFKKFGKSSEAIDTQGTAKCRAPTPTKGYNNMLGDSPYDIPIEEKDEVIENQELINMSKQISVFGENYILGKY